MSEFFVLVMESLGLIDGRFNKGRLCFYFFEEGGVRGFWLEGVVFGLNRIERIFFWVFCLGRIKCYDFWVFGEVVIR